MLTKHFFKILTLFAGMIVLGLLGVFLASYLEEKNPVGPDSKTQVAK